MYTYLNGSGLDLIWDWILECMCIVAQFVNPWTVVCQAPLSKGFSWQEYWNGLPFLHPGDLPDPGIESIAPALQADSSLLSHLGNGDAHPGQLKGRPGTLSHV